MTPSHKTEIRGNHVIKTELWRNPQKRNSLEQEEEILRDLETNHCPCVPRVIESGVASDGKRYLVTELIEQRAGFSLQDFWLSYLAVRGCGWEHGDLMIRHAIDDGTVTHLIDFDQAYAAADAPAWRKGYVESQLSEKLAAIESQPFFLGDTLLASRGISTMCNVGIYHSIEETIGDQLVFLHGERSHESRISLLRGIDFSGERVVDLGCNTGCVSRHIARDLNAAEVLGIERCRSHAILGQMLNCATAVRNCQIIPGEMSAGSVKSDHYDTALLFSVLHHVEDPRSLSTAIDEAGFRRLLIETKPHEEGFNFKDGHWRRSGGWKLNSWRALNSHLEAMFPGYRFNRSYGEYERGRQVLEFVRAPKPD